MVATDISFEISQDWKLIKAIVTHPKIYDHVSDDFSPEADAWEPVNDPAVTYVLVKDGEEILGLWAFTRQNGVCFEVHTCLLPNSWGERAHMAVQKLVGWVWENLPALRVITQVPAYNRHALKFAHLAGLTEYGLNPKAFMKHGQLCDVILLGISKPEAA